jgi:hypothetical protein
MIDDITDQMKDSIPHQSSTKLAEMIVAYRYLGLYKDVSMLAMEELGKRRANGDTFDFETHINDQLMKLPKLDFQKQGDIGTFFSKIGTLIKKVAK